MKSSKCSESKVIQVSKENCLYCLLLHGMACCTGQKHVACVVLDWFANGQPGNLAVFRLFHWNQAQKPARVLSPVGQRSWDVSWRWNTWAWREERVQTVSECHNLEAIENTGGGGSVCCNNSQLQHLRKCLHRWLQKGGRCHGSNGSTFTTIPRKSTGSCMKKKSIR